jgi:dienelactone hydrolase
MPGRLCSGRRGGNGAAWTPGRTAGGRGGAVPRRFWAVSRLGGFVVVAATAALLAGCGGGEEGPSVVVAPATALADEAQRITVRGLEPNQAATLQLQSIDAFGVRWASSATLRADGQGTVDLARPAARSDASTRESGTDLVSAMKPAGPSEGRYRWPERGPASFGLDVVVGDVVVASTTFARALPSDRYTVRVATTATTGFAGLYLAPIGDARRPPIVILGGAGGGLPLPVDVLLLAGHGYPVLALAYFAEDGVPVQLSRIPLEYFERALVWVNRRPQADGRGAVVWGISRGSEAALLLGVHYPNLVRAVVGLVPSNVSHCSEGCTGPAWTLGGRGLPFTRQFRPRPTDEPRAVIPVERIRGPLFLVCGGRDSTWNSCAHSNAIVDRLEAAGDRDRHRLHAYRGAGHGLGSLAPYQPVSAADNPTHAADQRARADVWPRVLEFLAGVERAARD